MTTPIDTQRISFITDRSIKQYVSIVKVLDGQAAGVAQILEVNGECDRMVVRRADGRTQYIDRCNERDCWILHTNVSTSLDVLLYRA